MRLLLRSTLTAGLLAALAAPASAQSRHDDSLAVVRTVAAFHDALARGDSAAALGLLAPDAVILESGSLESRAEYRSHHLPADIEFARALPAVRGPLAVTISGETAWATATSETRGTFKERQVNSVGAELMILSKGAAGWRIRAIHWSARNRRS